MLPSHISSTLPTAALNQSDSTYPPISTPTHGAQAWPSWVLPHPLNVLPCPCAMSGHQVSIQQHPVSISIPETKLPLSLEILYGCQGQTPSPRSVFDSPDQASSLRPSICTRSRPCALGRPPPGREVLPVTAELSTHSAAFLLNTML